MNTVFIIGFGRFGKSISEVFFNDFRILVYDKIDYSSKINSEKLEWTDEESGIQSADIIIYAVPISEFKSVFLSHLEIFKQKKTKSLIIDIQSVKTYSKQIYAQYLPENCDVLLTHPIFGPDSIQLNGYRDLKIMIDQHKCPKTVFLYWKNYFINKGFKVIELSSEKHDELAASSQGLVFLLSRILEEFQFKPTKIDTFWVEKLHDSIHMLTKDSWQLFADILTYNPYTKNTQSNFEQAFNNIKYKLSDYKRKEKTLRIGIQGDQASFNEEAVFHYIKKNQINHYKIKYLYTTDHVLNALTEGEIDLGQFAIHNSIGGLVQESIHAMGNHRFKIIDEYSIEIRHALMIHPEIDFSQIKKIMTHPQVIKQCNQNLKKYYPDLHLTSGKGKYIDHAYIAKLLSENKIDKTIAIIGSHSLAKQYGLTIIAENLQDLAFNLTGFLIVSR